MIIVPRDRFTPARLNPSLWLDAADASTLTLNSSTVSQWRDKSGNGYHAEQATALNQPAYTASALSGKPGLDFQSGDFLSLSGAALGLFRNVPGATVWAVVSGVVADATTGVIFAATVGTSANFRVSVAKGATNVWVAGNRRLDADSSQITSGGTVGTAARTLTSVLDYAGAKAFLYNNATLLGSADPFQTAGNSSDTDSQSVWVGGQGSASTLIGYIHELVAFPRAITAAEREQLNRYASAKWGIAL